MNLDPTFLYNGALLVALGYLLNTIRSIPFKLYGWFTKYFLLTLEFRDTDLSFTWFEQWYAQQTVRSRNYIAKGEHEKPIRLVPDYGMNWLWWNGVLILVNRQTLEDDKKIVVMGGEHGNGPGVGKEKFLVSFLSLDKTLLKKFCDLIQPEEEKGYCIYSSSYGGWGEIGRKHIRPVTTMVGVVNEVLEDAKQFLADEQWYHSVGVPWHRGYLLYGPPGNGKSSTAAVLASELGLGIYILDSTIDDKGLYRLMAELPDKAIVLFEDIDCLFNGRDKSDDGVKMSFSGLLNSLDGIATSQGRILLLTTNHPENLDPALIRPGRCDKKFLYDNPTESQVRELETKFGVPLGTITWTGEQSAASIQGELLLMKG